MAKSFNSKDIVRSIIKRDQFFKNQISAAKQIVTHFETEHYVLLSAQMQSGKTGCALYCAFDMLFSKKVDSVFIVSGTSDTDLRKQWELKCATHLCEYCSMHDIYDEEIIFSMNKLISSGIIWRQDLLKSKDKFSERFLIIWDESHFAITENQTLHTFLTEIGLLTGIQGNTTVLKEKSSYLLSVTATRCAEHSRLCGANDNTPVEAWKTVVMNPGESYRGVKSLASHNLVKRSFPISEEYQDKIQQILLQYSKQNKYMVIRCQSKNDYILQEIADKLGINVIKYNMETSNSADAKRRGTDIIDVSCLESCPSKFTLVFIRGMLRMGKELPKKHVCAVYEPGSVKHNTILQGLLGRVCGYYKNTQPDIHVYIPLGNKNKALLEYIDVIDSGFTRGISNTIHIPRITKVSERFTNIPFRIRLPKESYTIFTDLKSDVKKNIELFCQKILEIIEEETHGFSKKDYTSEQLSEIRSFLNDPKPDLIQSALTHKNGVLQRSVNKFGQMKDLSQALLTHKPILKYNTRKTGMIEKAMVISRINGKTGLEGDEYNQLNVDDFIVTFNTISKPDYALPKGVHVTNDRDIFHSTKIPGKIFDKETDGVAKSYLPTSVRTSPDIFKESLREAISKYLEQKHLQGGNYIGKQCLQKENYKNMKYVEKILANLEKEFEGKIKISCTSSRGRPPINEEGCIRLKTISWIKI